MKRLILAILVAFNTCLATGQAKPPTYPSLRVKMVSVPPLSDYARLAFKSTCVTGYNPAEDAIKFMNTFPPAMNIAFMINGDSLLLQQNGLPFQSGTTVHRMYIDADTGSYTLQFTEISTLDTTWQLTLVDSFAGVSVDMRSCPNGYAFQIIPNADSKGKRRFSVVIGVPASPLPVKLSRFYSSGGWLHWSTASEVNADRFEVQQSSDGSDFYTVGSVRASNRPSSYNYSVGVFGQRMYYRLRTIDSDGRSELSSTVTVSEQVSSKYVYPNPTTGMLNLCVGPYTVRDMNGNVVVTGESTGVVDISGLKPGMYNVDAADRNVTIIKQ